MLGSGTPEEGVTVKFPLYDVLTKPDPPGANALSNPEIVSLSKFADNRPLNEEDPVVDVPEYAMPKTLSFAVTPVVVSVRTIGDPVFGRQLFPMPLSADVPVQTAID